MSKNKNKKRRYQMQTGQPVTEMALVIEESELDDESPAPAGEGDLEKAGARHSAADQAAIQEIHWLAEQIGADPTLKRGGGKRMWIEVGDAPDPEAGALGKGLNAPAPAPALPEVAFIPITKVDEEKREVWGVLSEEKPDLAGEIMDYGWSKANFQKWSDETLAASQGKSAGNLRAMHQPIAAGKLISLQLNDAQKSIFIGAKVVDDNEWRKVQEGVYTGFSVGGAYGKRAMSNNLMRYEAKPSEASLVDKPCLPSALYSVIKADGSTELRKFAAENYLATESVAATLGTALNGDPNFLKAESGELEKVAGQAPTPGTITVPSEGDAPASIMPAMSAQVGAALELDPANLPPTAALQNSSNPGVQAVTPVMPAEPVLKADEPAEAEPSQAAQLVKRIGIRLLKDAPALETDWRKYGDPVNGAFKADSRLNALFAVGEFQLAKDRESYLPVEWAVIGRRLARLAEAETGLPLVYDARQKNIVLVGSDGVSKMDSKILGLMGDARAVLQEAQGQADMKDAADQVLAILDVALATASPAPNEPLPTPEPVAVAKAEGAQAEPPAPEPSAEEDLTKVENQNNMTVQPTPTPANEPPSAASPTLLMAGIGDDWMQSRLPAFMKALESNRVGDAYDVAGKSQATFDQMFTLAQYALLNEGGITKAAYEAGDLRKSIPFGAGLHKDALQKGINSSYAPNIYLQRLVRLMLPVVNPIRSRLASKNAPQGGQSAQWRAELGFASALSFAAALYNTPEADITSLGLMTGSGQTVPNSALSFAAPFKRIAFNEAVTMESMAAMNGYDDPFQVALITLLSALLRAEELKILLDNSAAIASPGTVTNTGSASGGTLAAATYTVRVTALTGIGQLLSTAAGFIGQAAQGETAMTASNTYVASGGASSLTVTWAAVPGAVGYNVYLDNGTNNRFYGNYTIPRAVLTAMPGSGNSAPVANNTANANGFEGILQWVGLSTVYSQAIPNKIFVEPSAASRALTLVGANGIAEFDSVLRQLWTTWNIAPTMILTSPQGAEYASKVISNSASGPYRIETQGRQGEIIGGMFLGGYVNKFAPMIGGIPRTVEIMGHPYVPNGTFSFLSESIPYPNARQATAWELETLIPYTYFPLAALNPSYPFMVLLSETLECYHPSAQAMVSGVDVTL